VRGTDFRDVMKDNANFFDGRGGNDKFILTKGNDVVRGQGGSDTFVFKGANVGDNGIRDFEAGSDKIEITSVSGMDDLTITIGDSGAFIAFEAGSIFLDFVTEVSADFFSF
jgi:Ca2+-binding RTX toxin-like protein